LKALNAVVSLLNMALNLTLIIVETLMKWSLILLYYVWMPRLLFGIQYIFICLCALGRKIFYIIYWFCSDWLY